MTHINTKMNMFSALSEEQEKDYTPVGTMSADAVLEDFPEIGSGSLGTAGFGKKNKKKKFTYTVSASLIDELKGKKDAVFEKRAEALKTIEEKTGIEQRLRRTKLCNSVKTGTPCPHGERCRFAHSEDELEVAACVFGDNCRFTRLVNGTYVNNNTRRICKFKHTGETNEDFFVRTGMTPKKPVVEDTEATVSPSPVAPSPVAPPLVVSPLVVSPPVVSPPVVEKVVLRRMSRGFEAREAAKICDAIESGNHETVIRVYKELAVRAFQMMIDCGRTNIRFEII